ncbi:arsenate reductase (glutaredoxin) [Alphaproteobacteria bacterium]|jgi:arsenate reductase|nr:arsenate reductase (glutaredoxin) [Alphaproteobacteria bacterium]|tara:strand:- start:2293 stop:2649 length:357 start_codon:yes stop_codon:yes gene_type:complete
MNNKLVIYHNPRCSKSRQTLEIIKSKNIEPTIVLYLIDKLSKDEIKNLLLKLGLSIREILRTGEEEYKKNNLQNKNLSNEKLIEFLIKFPKLLQRPIVIKNNKAIIARPPENIFNLLK